MIYTDESRHPLSETVAFIDVRIWLCSLELPLHSKGTKPNEGEMCNDSQQPLSQIK